MPCPICDQKPMNCDCTEAERRMYSEAEDLREQVAQMRLTDAERTCLGYAIRKLDSEYAAGPSDVLRGLLQRLA